MANELKTEKDGVVKGILAKKGDAVKKDQYVVELE